MTESKHPFSFAHSIAEKAFRRFLIPGYKYQDDRGNRVFTVFYKGRNCI
jgi:hypothetical protein